MRLHRHQVPRHKSGWALGNASRGAQRALLGLLAGGLLADHYGLARSF